MKHLFAAWEDLAPLINVSHLLLFSDYDGTLVPIVAHPEMAKLLAPQRTILRELSKQKDVTVGIISGRALPDLKKMVALPGIMYAGNHGLELEGPGFNRVHPDIRGFKQNLRKMIPHFKKAYRNSPGILVEAKTFGLSIHYRRVPENNVETAKAILMKELKPYLHKSLVVLTHGKKVWEIRPSVLWDKGHTVQWLIQQGTSGNKTPVLPFYLGDDLTDEDAFQALKYRGLTVKITENPEQKSAAAYYLRSPAEVYVLFRRILSIKKTRIGKKEKK